MENEDIIIKEINGVKYAFRGDRYLYNATIREQGLEEEEKRKKKLEKIKKVKENNRIKERLLKDNGVLYVNNIRLIYDYKIAFDNKVYYIVADSLVSKKSKIRKYLRTCAGCKNTPYEELINEIVNICNLSYCLDIYDNKNFLYIYEELYENDFKNNNNRFSDLD